MTASPIPLERRVLGPNPFSESDPRYALWVDASRLAAEEEALLMASIFERIQLESEQLPSTSNADALAGMFDIRAKYFSIFMVESYKAAVDYEQFLERLSESMLALAAKTCRAADKQDFLNELRSRLRQRSMHWTAEALSLARETEGGEPPPKASVALQHGKTSRSNSQAMKNSKSQ